MLKKPGIIVLFIIGLYASQHAEAQSTPPKNPAAPAVPVVPGANQNRRIGEIPPLPPLPNRENQNDEQVKIIDSYELTVLGAYPNGNTANNTANTIKNAQYILYSNRNIEIRLLFTNGTEYVYHLRNARSVIEISIGSFRETFDAIVQVEKQFLLEQYIGELIYNENTITSFNLIGNNKVVVLLNVKKK